MSRRIWWLAVLCMSLAGSASGATIFVTTERQGIGTGACSLQEAIYSSALHDTLDGTHGIAIDATDPDHFITTQCVLGTGDDTIVLPTGGVLQMDALVDGDAYNAYGPTATPIIFSTITIEGNGATLQWNALNKSPVRLFAIGSASIKKPHGTASGTGSLTLRNAYVRGFHVKGGDGRNGGGGGLGAGGAIYLQNGSLVVESSTFAQNGAVGGGIGGSSNNTGAGGGGGGLGGNGGEGQFAGGGGGGSRGDGGKGNFGGGGGGGTVFAGGSSSTNIGSSGGYLCGGNGGDSGDNGNDGRPGKCPGGGGGGTGSGDNPIEAPFPTSVNGGEGNYGGGGGGGFGAVQGGNGGDGGFGGGGGGGAVLHGDGGDGGFGGGGGAGGPALIGKGAGKGGAFGGNGADGGGGGGALGGAIFNDGGTVTVRNSTFTNNAVTRGLGGSGAGNGGDAGGAIFSHDGDLTIVNSTFSGNQSTGSGGAVVVYMDPSDSGIFGGPDVFIRLTLDNTILANNGANECFFTGNVHTQGAGNLITSNGSGTQPFGACPGVVTSADPQLGALQDNGGFTPTMAIPFGSVAMSTADATSSLATDQRGVDRPEAGGFDIGALEVCRRRLGGLIIPFNCGGSLFHGGTTFQLTVAATAGGSVTPAPGTYDEPANTVAVLKVTPDLGYQFTGWTGNVAVPTSASTTVTMSRDQTVTAFFTFCGCVLDVSDAIAVTRGGFVLNLVTGRYVQTVTLTNTSGSSITGPISLVLDNLSSYASLFNASGSTDSLEPPAGSRYLNVTDNNLGAGTSVSVQLQFTDATRTTPINYSTRVLAGPGAR